MVLAAAHHALTRKTVYRGLRSLIMPTLPLVVVSLIWALYRIGQYDLKTQSRGTYIGLFPRVWPDV